jgi:DNA polymerase-3 subunit alpha
VVLVDPIEYGLIWERFWNRGRKGSMPDIDLDIDPEQRDVVIEYLINKFGKNKVFPMMTLSKFKPKAVLKDVGKAVGLPFNYMNEISKLFPPKPKSLQDAIERSSDLELVSHGEDKDVVKWKEQLEKLKKKRKALRKQKKRDFGIEGDIIELRNQIVERSKKLLKAFRNAKKLENVARQRGKHACALMISDKPVFGRIPLVWDTTHKTLMTGFDMHDVEKMGYLKLDVLGLANAAIVSRILPNGIYDIIKQGFEDPEVFRLLGTGNCKGIFQLESHLGRRYAKKLKPNNLLEVSDLVSILRPATLGTGLTDQYLQNRKSGQWTLIHDDLRSIFQPTYGIMCYQEQMLEVVRKFGGFD